MTGLRPATFLVLVLMVLASAGSGACSSTGSRGQLTVFGPWTGSEAERFRAVLRVFEENEKIEVGYEGTRALDQILTSELQKGTPPDIAVLPSPGELKRYESVLMPLEDVVDVEWSEYGPQWQKLSKSDLDHLYAIPILVHLKSMVWYNTNGSPLPKPRTLDELITLRSTTDRGATWCMGMGSAATSGWPGTDWIEDIVLQRQGVGFYQRWVAGRVAWNSQEIREAWETWGKIASGARQLRGLPAEALLTDFVDAGRPMFEDPQGCALEHQASFITGFYENYRKNVKLTPEVDFNFFDFPESDGYAVNELGRSRLASADLAVMFNDKPEVQKLMRFLASKEAQQIWPRADPIGFSANTKVPGKAYRDEVSKRIRNALVGSDTLCFDASDMMPATMRNAFYRAVLEYLIHPHDPRQLDELLSDLDKIRKGLPAESWWTVSCGRDQ